MKLFYNPSGTVKVLPVSVLPVNAVWNGGFPYTPEGSLLVSIVSAKPTDTVSNGGFIQELWGGVCAGYDTPSIWIGGLAITSYGALCLDVDGGIVTDGPALYNSLTHTAVPQRAAPGTTATFTRATTKTVENNDGYLVTLLAGEIGFVGARRVRNLLTNTGWLGGVSGTPGTPPTGWVSPVGTGTITFSDSTVYTGNKQITFSATAQRPFISTAVAVAAYSTYLESVYLLASDGVSRITDILVATSLPAGSTETYYINGVVVASTVIPNAGDRLTYKLTTAGTTGTPNWRVGTGCQGAITASVTLVAPQLEDVTAQTTQTAGEYVSVGVPSDWAGDELVTNGTFDTDTTWIKESGWTIGGGAAIAATASATLYQTDTLAIGTKYVASFSVSSVSAGSVSIRIGAVPLVPYDFKTAAGTYSVEFVADAVSTLVGVIGVGFTGTVDNINVKPAYYHGSMVDGVKCFPTDLSGNPLTGMLGYQVEGARTNLFKYSNTFSSLGSNGPLTETQNAIGPNGQSNYAWTLTDDSAVVTEDFYNDVTLTAAVYTQQIKVKKTTGAQTAYPVLHCTNYAGTLTARCTIDTTNGIATVWTAATGFTVQPSSARCHSQNANFWIVELTFTGTADAGWFSVFVPAGTTNPVQSTGILDVSAQGSHVVCDAQVELGSFASSYIATTTIAVARNADVLTYPSAGNIDGTKGWVYAEFDVANDSDGNQNIIIGSDVAGVFPLYAQPSLGNVRTLDGTNAPIAQSAPMTGVRKGAGTWGGSTMQSAHNGVVSSTTAFDGNMEVTAVIRIGEDNAGNSHFFGTIKNLYIGQRQLSASELGAITS